MTDLSRWEMLHFYFFNIVGKESTASCPITSLYHKDSRVGTKPGVGHGLPHGLPQVLSLPRTVPRLVRSTKLSPVRRVSTWMGDQIRITLVIITSFSFFPFPFQGDITAYRTPLLCNAVSSTCIYHQFVRHFALSVFTCIYLQMIV